MAVELGALSLRISADGAGLLHTLDAIETKARGAGSRLDGMGRGASRAMSALGSATDVAGRSMGNLRNSVANLQTVLAVTGVVAGVRSAVGAFNELTRSQMVLAGSSKITGIPLAQLQATSLGLQKNLHMGAVTANQFTAAATRLAVSAGKTNMTGQFLTAWLDLAASRGLSAADAMAALETTLIGQDEGLNRLGLANPEGIYKKWADAMGTTSGKMTDAQKAQAIMNEVMAVGGLVTGSYAERMGTFAGAVDIANQQKQTFLATLGEVITTSPALIAALGSTSQGFVSMGQWVVENRASIQGLVGDVVTLVGHLVTLGGWIGKVVGWFVSASAATQNFGAKLHGIATRNTTAGRAARNRDEAMRDGGFTADLGSAATSRAPIVITAPRTGAAGTGGGPRVAPTISPLAFAAINDFGRTLATKPIPLPIAPTIAPPALSALDAQIAQLGLRLDDTFAGLNVGIADSLGRALSAGFTTAFEGGNFFQGMGNALLQGLGGIFTQLGAELITYGLIMEGLLPFLSNPFTSGFAAIAAGVALIGAGAAMGAIAGGGRKGGRIGGGGRPGRSAGASSTVSLGPRAPNFGSGQAAEARTPVNIGTLVALRPEDPQWQRLIGDTVNKTTRRGVIR